MRLCVLWNTRELPPAETLDRESSSARPLRSARPLNAAPGIPFERPADDVINAFAKILADKGLNVSVRKSRGRDIRAACGQLIVEGQGTRKTAALKPAESP